MIRQCAPVLLLLLASCGVVGLPVAPENVGAALTIERQKQRDAAEQQKAAAEPEPAEPDPTISGQDMDLPPLRPVGTR